MVAFGFLENALGSMFIIAGVIASNIPKSKRSVTLKRKMIQAVFLRFIAQEQFGVGSGGGGDGNMLSSVLEDVQEQCRKRE